MTAFSSARVQFKCRTLLPSLLREQGARGAGGSDTPFLIDGLPKLWERGKMR